MLIHYDYDYYHSTLRDMNVYSVFCARLYCYQGPGGLVNHMGFHPLKEEMMGPDSSVGIRPVKPESKKHPSLPKEVGELCVNVASFLPVVACSCHQPCPSLPAAVISPARCSM